MLRRTVIIVVVGLLALAAITTTGCRRVRLADTAQATRESKTAALEGATSIEARVVMGVGELKVSGEATTTDALKAEFTYSPASWKPEVSYTVDAGVGKLEVRQPESKETPSFGDSRNSWDLVLAGGVPTDLSLKLGVGTSDIDLGSVDVRTLDVLSGVGECTLDLSGPRPNGMTARVETGVGELTIKLPRNVGVKVRGRDEGLGETTAIGFVAQGGGWVNEAYASTGPKIEIELTNGIGDVTLELVD